MPKPNCLLSLFLSFCLILEQSVFAQTIDLSHYFVRNPAQAVPQSDKFRPLHLRYVSYDSQANDFKILLDKGDFFKQKTEKPKNEKTLELEKTTQELMKYFFIGLALPNEKFWVNLRPDSPDNILDPDLEKTDIGKIFLEADLQLKKDTAGLTSPQTKEGKEYWDKLYRKAQELFGSENTTIPTITRPWIVPDEIIIRETTDSAYVYKATLKVMLKQDYLKNDSVYNFKDERLKQLNEYSSQLIRELIIPKLTKEVNTFKRYAPLRQVYYSLILSSWFKARNKGLSNFINSKDLANLISKENWSKTTYFQAYQRSFKDSEYNIKKPVYTPSGQVIRSYFSGGISGIAPLSMPLFSSETTTVETGRIVSSPAIGDKLPNNSYLVKFSATNNLGEVIMQDNLRGTKPTVGSPLKIEEQSASSAIVNELRNTTMPNLDENRRKAIRDYLTQAFFEQGHEKVIDNFLDGSQAISESIKEIKITVPGFIEKYGRSDLGTLATFITAYGMGRFGFNDSRPVRNFLSWGSDAMIEAALALSQEKDIGIIEAAKQLVELKTLSDIIEPDIDDYKEKRMVKHIIENLEYLSRLMKDTNKIEEKHWDIVRRHLLIPEALRLGGNSFNSTAERLEKSGLDKRTARINLTLGIIAQRHKLSNSNGQVALNYLAILFRETKGNQETEDLVRRMMGGDYNPLVVEDILNEAKAMFFDGQDVGWAAIRSLSEEEIARIRTHFQHLVFPDELKDYLVALELYFYNFIPLHYTAQAINNTSGSRIKGDLSGLSTGPLIKFGSWLKQAKEEMLNAAQGEQQLAVSPASDHSITDKSAESPVKKEPASSAVDSLGDKGGIDFSALPIVSQAMSNLKLSASSAISLSQLNSISLNQEFQEIQKMAEAGIIPSADRIKEYVQVSCLKGNIDMQKVVSCIADILRQEEEGCISSDQILLDILVVLESNRSVEDLRAIFLPIYHTYINK